MQKRLFVLENCQNFFPEGDLERVAKFLQESILIDFDFIWNLLLSDRNFANLRDSPLLPTSIITHTISTGCIITIVLSILIFDHLFFALFFHFLLECIFQRYVVNSYSSHQHITQCLWTMECDRETSALR